MSPFYFGHGSRRLFGIYDAARITAGPARAALFCNALGKEYIHSHRAIRQAAIMLAEAKVHTLRFDYFGTGDSAGEMQDANLDIWDEDIRCGIREVKDISGADRVTLVGLRLGALLAARAAAALPEQIDRLVLWDPVLDGRTYLDEQFQACYSPHFYGRGPVPRPSAAGGGFEVLGYPISERLVREICQLNLQSSIGALPPDAFALVSGDPDDEAKLRSMLGPEPTRTAVLRIEGSPCWQTAWPNPVAIIPAELIRQLVRVAS